MPGSLTSRIRQLGPSLRGLDKNSCAVPKDLDRKPTDSRSSWRDSRTSLSSSTIYTVGTSCVLITTRTQSKRKFKVKMSKLRLTMPDRLYRMMQCNAQAGELCKTSVLAGESTMVAAH